MISEGPGGVCRAAPDDGQILLLQSPLLHSGGENGGSGLGLGKDHNAPHLPVQPVDGVHGAAALGLQEGQHALLLDGGGLGQHSHRLFTQDHRMIFRKNGHHIDNLPKVRIR